MGWRASSPCSSSSLTAPTRTPSIGGFVADVDEQAAARFNFGAVGSPFGVSHERSPPRPALAEVVLGRTEDELLLALADGSAP